MPDANNASLWASLPDPALSKTDPEFYAIYQHLLGREILPGKSLDDRQKALVTLAALAVRQTPADLARVTGIALDLGVSPGEIREAIYQIAPYVGLSTTTQALYAINKTFTERKIALPLPNQGTVNAGNRFAKGLETQMGIFGKEHISRMQENAPAGQKNLLVNYLSAWCFGDFYTRKILDLKMRELLTFTAIVTLGGCEPQAKAHAAANISVGNTKQNLVDALAVMLPWIGFPRTLNGLAAVNAAVPE